MNAMASAYRYLIERPTFTGLIRLLPFDRAFFSEAGDTDHKMASSAVVIRAQGSRCGVLCDMQYSPV